MGGVVAEEGARIVAAMEAEGAEAEAEGIVAGMGGAEAKETVVAKKWKVSWSDSGSSLACPVLATCKYEPPFSPRYG